MRLVQFLIRLILLSFMGSSAMKRGNKAKYERLLRFGKKTIKKIVVLGMVLLTFVFYISAGVNFYKGYTDIAKWHAGFSFLLTIFDYKILAFFIKRKEETR